ncbi:acylneuraminate cytidylyltransferase family protein [Candidatus Pelagibacter ubique]|nr:acylneuraminate cytidylyltransferase family protein [Candidatus Pelagibacter ubique]
MIYNDKIIAIIPARSGSKSIKDKNIVNFRGKPLIAWSIEQCFKSKKIDKVFLSTDSKKYANIAKKFGLKNIIFRPKSISKDKSTDYEFIKHFIDNVDTSHGIIAHMRPTTPLRNVVLLDKIINFFLKNKNFSSLRSVHENPETAYKSFELKKKILTPLKGVEKTMDELNSPRQNFSKTYSANGYIDLYKKRFIIRKKKLFGDRVVGYKTPFTMEIDSKAELNLMNLHDDN